MVSIKTNAVGSQYERERWISFFKCTQAVSVEWPGLYEDYWGLSRLLLLICSLSWYVPWELPAPLILTWNTTLYDVFFMRGMITTFLSFFWMGKTPSTIDKFTSFITDRSKISQQFFVVSPKEEFNTFQERFGSYSVHQKLKGFILLIVQSFGFFDRKQHLQATSISLDKYT